MRDNDTNNVSVFIINRTTAVSRLDCCIDLELSYIISNTTIGADNTLGDLDGVAEEFSIRISSNQHFLTEFHVLKTQKTVRG